MNLLDYQKSGNAFGATVTPFAPFNPLRGTIPNIPDIWSVWEYNSTELDSILKYIQEIEYDPSYVPSAFGFRYDLVTPRGFAFITADGLATDTAGSQSGLPFLGYDPFSQAIGSFPVGPGAVYNPFFSGGDALEIGGSLLFGQPYILAGESPLAVYAPYQMYLLPLNYRRNVHFERMRYTNVDEIVNQQTGGTGFGAGAEAVDPLNPNENVPLQTNSAVVYLPAINIFPTTPLSQAKSAYGDQVGKNYKTFTYRKEQYIYLFGEVSVALGNSKVGLPPQLVIYDPIPEYQIYCMATKLNFMSMFVNIDDKRAAFTFSNGYVNPANVKPKSFWSFEFNPMDGWVAPNSSQNKTSYPDFDRVIHEYPAGTFSADLTEFYDQLSMPNPVTYGDNGYEFNDQYFHIMENRISRFAFHAFKQIEDTLYTDLRFDVEPPVMNMKYIPNPPKQGGGGVHMGDTGDVGSNLGVVDIPTDTPRTSFPGGIPYNSEKVELAEWASAKNIKAPVINTQTPYLLTANVKSVYNYLSTHWENVLREIPETAIPPIFISQGQIEGAEQPGQNKGPTQDQLISDPVFAGKNSYAFSQLYEQAMKCKSYFELNEWATSKGYGKHSKIIYVPNERYLNTIEEAKINYPMYNEIEFDIYSNTNRSIVNLFRKHGISKSILASYMANIFAPLSKTEYSFDTTPNPENFVNLFLETLNNPEGEIAQTYENMLLSLNKAYDSGVFTSAIYQGSDGSGGPGIGTPGDKDRHYYIFKTIRAPFLHEVGDPNTQVDSVATNFSQSKINLNLDKFFQYYITTYNAQQGFIDPGNAELEEGFMLKNSVSYSDYYSEFGPPDELFLPQGMPGYDDDSSSSYVLGMAALPEIQRKIQQLMPQINEILSKKPNYSEPLMYEIEKSVGSSMNVVQRIFIPHFGEGFNEKELLTTSSEEPKIKKIKYIDTQVKYGEMYTYKIKQYRLVVGGDYRFVFSSNEDTHRRALALGYGERYESDIIMKAARSFHQEGPMIYDAKTPPFAEGESIPSTAFQQPFMFYTKIPNFDVPSSDYSTQSSKIFDIKDYAVNVEGDYPMEDIPDYFSGEEPSKMQRLKKLAIFKSMVYPNVQITPVPYYEQTVAVADFPPLPPNVNIDPLVGKGSTVLMTFEHQVGDREEVPIIVNDYDELLFAVQRVAQNRDSQNGSGQFVTPSIRFKTDDFPKSYQIFVMDKKPSNYQSFKDKMALELNVEDATAIKQSLVPNKKYYFMFRTVDIHANISNPSIVYEVEMVFNSGVYYPIVNEYEFEKQTIGTKIKPFKQYAKIEAALIQRVVNMGASSINEQSSVMKEGREPILGVAGEKIWDQRKFKFRIISKHTGKAIDLNVKFKTNYTESGEKGCS